MTAEAHSPPARFLLISLARGGSTSVRMTLNQHPDMLCHGELFGGAVRAPSGPGWAMDREELRLLRATDIDAFVDTVILAEKHKTIGVKLLFEQLTRVSSCDFTRRIVLENDFRVIYLWRRDLFGRFMSDLRNQRKYLFDLERDESDGRYVIDPRRVVQDAKNQIAMARNALMLYSGLNAIAAELEYLVAEPRKGIDTMCDFLGVERGKIWLDPSKRAKAAAKDFDIRSLIANYDELVESETVAPYRNFAWSEVAADLDARNPIAIQL